MRMKIDSKLSFNQGLDYLPSNRRPVHFIETETFLAPI
jgi:hypothetical protein